METLLLAFLGGVLGSAPILFVYRKVANKKEEQLETWREHPFYRYKLNRYMEMFEEDFELNKDEHKDVIMEKIKRELDNEVYSSRYPMMIDEIDGWLENERKLEEEKQIHREVEKHKQKDDVSNG